VPEPQAVVQVEWHQLSREDPLGLVIVELSDGTRQERGRLTRTQAAQLAIQAFEGRTTRLPILGGIVKWIRAGST
jgi:hypothetical protein